MKVVLFCGGMGMRLREYSESIPKPMVPIGNRPILWHLMKYYAHFGHKDFILCLGWQGSAIKEYFLNYNECATNDFVLTKGGRNVDLLSSDIDDWSITFVDTGASTCIGQRLRAVERHLEGETVFLANYADGLSDFHLPDLIEMHREKDAVAAFLSVPPKASFHAVNFGAEGDVRSLTPIAESKLLMNGGFFVLRQEIFDYLKDGEDLVIEPFERLIAEGRLCSIQYDGFWNCMDTYKEKQQLDDLIARGDTPWQVWNEATPSRSRYTPAATPQNGHGATVAR